MSTPLPSAPGPAGLARLPMVPGALADALFARYQRNQYAIGKRTEAAIAGAWRAMITDPWHFSDVWKGAEPLLTGIATVHHDASAADAAEYYTLTRSALGLPGQAVPGVPLAPGYMAHVINAMGAGQFFHFLGAGDDEEAASARAMAALSGAAVRMVMNGGRGTVAQAAAGDASSLGWERILEGLPGAASCGYCSGLAGGRGMTKAPGEKFHAHDGCYCLARSVFSGQESMNTALRGEYARATRGKSGKAADAAWNAYWSDRNATTTEAVLSAASTGNGASQPEAEGAPPGEGAGNAPVAGEPV